MDASRIGLIACDVFREELEVRADLPRYGQIVWLPMALHDRPADMRQRLQAEIDRLEAADVDVILLLFGLCGGGLDGVCARRRPLVIPRAPDCISILIGSNARRNDIQRNCLGTYFYAPGWIRERRVPGPDREAWIRSRYADQYDEETVNELVEVDRESFAPYERAMFIQTLVPSDGAAYCQRCAAHLGWKFAVEQGDPTWLDDVLLGRWDAARFAVAAPGQTLRQTAGDDVIAAEEATP